MYKMIKLAIKAVHSVREEMHESYFDILKSGKMGDEYMVAWMRANAASKELEEALKALNKFH